MGSFKWQHAVGGGGLILAYFMFTSQKPIAPVAKPLEPIKKMTAKAVLTTPEEMAQEAAPQSSPAAPSRAELNKSYMAMVTAGLREIPVKVQGKNLVLQILPKATPEGCRPGDFDLLKGITTNGSTKSFLLSVEELNGEKRTMASHRLNLFNFTEKKPYEVVLPRSEAAADYGIYLCIDSGGATSCRNKTIISPKDWNQALAGKTVGTMHFQMITTKGDKGFLIPSATWGEETIAKLSKDLESVMGNPRPSLQLLTKMMQTLGTLAAQPNQTTLNLNLTYARPECVE